MCSKETVLTTLRGGSGEKQQDVQPNKNPAPTKKRPPSHDER